MKEEEGYESGQVCNRDGCGGVIEEKNLSSCCSCHIVAPCGHCTTPPQYCPECGWDAAEEERERDRAEWKARNANKPPVKPLPANYSVPRCRVIPGGTNCNHIE